LGMVNLAQERALNKACLKPACFIIWLQFGLPISVDLTLMSQIMDLRCAFIRGHVLNPTIYWQP
jgi:hypothetical protein